MKTIFILISVMMLSFSSFKVTPSDFDYKLSEIARKFRIEIMSLDECENLKTLTYYLVDEINDAIEMVEEYSYEEKLELKKLKKEAEALVQFIAVVGDCGNYTPSIDEFNLANKRVNARVSSVIKDKYCVDVILVEIGNYTTFLIKNKSAINYTVSYKYKTRDEMSIGSGKMGLSKYSVRNILNNREETTKKNISFFEISCKEF